MGVKYANSRNWSFVTSPYNSNQKLRVSARQRFMLFLLAVSVVRAGSFSSTLLLVWIVLLVVLLSKYGAKISDSSFFLFYTFYLIWLLFSLTSSPEKAFGFRVFAKYVFPFLVALVASSIPNTDAFFMKALKVSLLSAIVLNLIYGLTFVLPIGFITWPVFEPIIWWGAPIVDFNPFVMVVALVLYQKTNKKIYLYAICLFFLVPVVTSVRTGLIGLAVSLLAISFFKYKLRALPIFIIIIFGVIGSILYIPGIRNKMFQGAFNSSEEVINSLDVLSLDDLDTSGRLAMWEWTLDTFYKDDKVLGAGLGQVQARFYSGNHPFSVEVVHNDYVQILCDTGQVGLTLYLIIIGSFVICSFRIYNNNKYRESARNSAFIAGTSLCGIMACAFTDNVINYSLLTLTYPYVFFGFALALKKN
jgi:O-antigen ligase